MNSHFPLAKKNSWFWQCIRHILFSGLHTFQRLFCNNNYLTRKFKSVIWWDYDTWCPITISDAKLNISKHFDFGWTMHHTYCRYPCFCIVIYCATIYSLHPCYMFLKKMTQSMTPYYDRCSVCRNFACSKSSITHTYQSWRWS